MGLCEPQQAPSQSCDNYNRAPFLGLTQTTVLTSTQENIEVVQRHHHFLAAVAGLLTSRKPNFHEEMTHFRDMTCCLAVSQVDLILSAFPAKAWWIQETKWPGSVVAVM